MLTRGTRQAIGDGNHFAQPEFFPSTPERINQMATSRYSLVFHMHQCTTFFSASVHYVFGGKTDSVTPPPPALPKKEPDKFNTTFSPAHTQAFLHRGLSAKDQ